MTIGYLISGTALAIALGSPIVSLNAQTWQTILDYQPGPGQPAGGRHIAADSAGNIISGGYGRDSSGFERGTVLQSQVGESSWLLSDDTNPSASQFRSWVRSGGFDAFGNMYSVGQLTPQDTGVPYWYVRRSSDGGANWSTVDQYRYAAGEWANPTGFAADDSGNIFVAGWGRAAAGRRNTSGNIHWLVRKSSDGGETWTLSDDLEGPSASFGAGGAGFVPGAGVFVVGDEFTGGTGWRVRRSINGLPGTWATVDGPIAYGSARGVGSDSQGTIYVSGTLFVVTSSTKKGQTGYYAWSTRKSIDSGSTWATTDTYSYSGSQTSWAQCVGRDAAGNVVVAGFGADAQGRQHWLVRKLESGVWRNLDDFQLVPGFSALASGIATDATGNLLVSGNASDGQGSHWIIRKLANR